MALLTHNDLKITRREITLARLPEGFDGLQVLQLSDLHFYEYTDPRYYRRVAAEVNALQADLIVMTGDVVHYGPHYVAMAGEFLAQLQAKSGKLAILGNHDYNDGGRSRHVAAMLGECGFQLLKNSHVCLQHGENRLWVLGLDDLWYGQPDIVQALAGVPAKTEPVIALAHNPLLFDPLALGGHGPVDLVLAGHTHAGHVYIPFLGPIYRRIFRMKYRYGLYEKNGCQLHVSSGVGSAAFYLKKQKLGFPRFRFNTHPEIAVLTLRR